MAVLEIEQLTIALDSQAARRPILADVTLHVDGGETVALVGESGSGKSVTSRAALGVYPESSKVTGRVRVDGFDVLAARRAQLRNLRRSSASMVFQDPRASVNPLSRVGDFITEALRARGVGRTASRSRAVSLLEAVGISDPERALDRYPHEFSGGMLQRVVIAAAMSIEPKLLLADEPTTMLDVTTQAEVLALLKRLQREHGTGMLFVTHDLELAAAISDRVYVMYAGRIVESEPTGRLFTHPRHPYTRALMDATPSLESDSTSMRPIAGRPPSLSEHHTGCAFAPRCAFAEERCTNAPPPLEPDGAGQVACFVATKESRL